MMTDREVEVISRRSLAKVEMNELSFPSQSVSKEGSLPFLLIFCIVNPTHCSGHVSYFKTSPRCWIVQRALALLYSKPQETLPMFLVPDPPPHKKSHLCRAPCGFIMEASVQLWSGSSQGLGSDDSDSE